MVTKEGLSQDEGNSLGEGAGDLGHGEFLCETVVLCIDFH
jgi:hypothetical protein